MSSAYLSDAHKRLWRPRSMWVWVATVAVLGLLVAAFLVPSPYGRLSPGPSLVMGPAANSPAGGSDSGVAAVSVAYTPVSWAEVFGDSANLTQLSYSTSSDWQDVVDSAQAAAHALTGRSGDVYVDDPGWLGGSAGLALALHAVDAQWAGALSRGRVVAATGVIDASGDVGPVAGVALKLESAVFAGATVLVVPAGLAPDADLAGLDVIEASSLRAAVEQLCDDSCPLPPPD